MITTPPPTINTIMRTGASQMDLMEEMDGTLRALLNWAERFRRNVEAHFPAVFLPGVVIGTVNAQSIKSFTQQFSGAQGQNLNNGVPVTVGFDQPLPAGLFIPLGQVTALNTITWYVGNVTAGNITFSTPGLLTLIPIIP